jgi:tetratricopeptide (TPR) repeat protein
MRLKMKISLKIITLLIFALFITGCAAAGVPMTFNPNTKLNYADGLLGLDRPLPAESLIQEAIDIYKKRGDDLGLADAYRNYAFFLQSDAVESWKGFYQKYGFKDRTVTFDSRYQKAMEYFEMARDIYTRYSSYDMLTNIYLSMGKSYYFNFNDKEKACNNFTKSLECYLKFKEENPDETVELPKGFSSYEDYISAAKEEVGCLK